jgi:predicted ribosomally synthesized peptide with nif11-like leader
MIELVFFKSMAEQQITALLARIKDDAGLREKLQGAANLEAAQILAKEAGFDVSKAEWLRYHASQTLELSDAELESVSGGVAPVPPSTPGITVGPGSYC